MPEPKKPSGTAAKSGAADDHTRPDGDDRVGYGHPPKQHRFKKGKSGNPKGRPKKAHQEPVDNLAILNEQVPVRRNGKTEWMPAFEASLRKLVERALKDGDVSAGIRFVRICEKSGLFKKTAAPRSGGVVHMTDDELAKYDEEMKRQRERIERDRVERHVVDRS